MRLLLLVAVSFFIAQLAAANDYQALESEIEKAYGVKVEFEDIEFPEHWVENYAPYFETVNVENRQKYLSKLQTDLERYNEEVLRTHTTKIFIFRVLSFKDVPYGGTTYSPEKWLYMNALWLGDSGSSAMGFHHEFSSLLLNQNKFPTEEWKALNPAGFIYPMEGKDTALLTVGDTDLIGNEETYKDGFVAGYGRMDFENDINTFFQLLIGNPEKLATLESEYPAVRMKAELLRKFYNGVVASSKLSR